MWRLRTEWCGRGVVCTRGCERGEGGVAVVVGRGRGLLRAPRACRPLAGGADCYVWARVVAVVEAGGWRVAAVRGNRREFRASLQTASSSG